MNLKIALAIAIIGYFASFGAVAETPESLQESLQKSLPVKTQKKPGATKSVTKSKEKASAKSVGKLPEKKTKTKTFIDFDSDSQHKTTVVVRTPLPLEESKEEKAEVDRLVQEIKKDTPAEKTKSDKPELKYLVPVQVPVPVAATSPTPTPSGPPIAIKNPPAAQDTPAPVILRTTVITTATPAPIPSQTPTATVATRLNAAPTSKPEIENQSARLLARSSYVSAHFNELAPELQNGLTTFAFGLAKPFTRDFEGRAMIEIGHGTDQAVTPQNTRHFLLRGDTLKHFHFFNSEVFSFLAGTGFGYADINVRSYRTSGGSTLVEREHSHVSTAFVSPTIALRLASVGELTFDLSIEYLVLLGANSTSLAGLTGAVTLTYPLF